MSYLVLFDTDRIQDYVFATQKLRAMRGGSFLLERLNRETRETIMARGGQVIYVGGGAGAARFEDKTSALNFCCALEAEYRKETIIAGITTCIAEQTAGESFKDWLERAEKGLRRRKDAKDRSIPLVNNPYAKVCEFCGRLPAEGDPVKNKYICMACKIQWDMGMNYKHSLIYKAIEEKFAFTSITWPESLEDIGQASDPEGYIGLIYADGNRMGQRRQDELKRCQDTEVEEKYWQFSECVDKATRWAMVDAVTELLGQPVANKPYPVQFFITGGDDMLAAVPAQQAVPIALKFGELFEQYYKVGRPEEDVGESFAGMGQDASVAMGAALAKQNYPLHSLINTARQLQKSAKQLAWKVWKETGKDVSTIDFLATSSSLLKPIQEQRAEELAYDQLRLTQRPYAIDDAGKLVELIRGLKSSGFPQNKVNDLWRPLYRGRLAACLDFLVLLSRLSDRGGDSPQQALAEVAKEFNLSPFPWRLTPDFHYITPLLDLAELYDFINL
ncbi:MAG: hypothetical protein PHW74_10415 [Desulfobacca sp.]|nr:hypothetical protein [Desulfobacca sp.]